MRKRTKYRLPFTKSQGKDTNLSAMTSQPASPSCKLYRSIHQLPLAKFITCVCDEYLSALIIEGVASGEELAAAWETIYNEYLDAIKDENMQFVEKLTKDYNLLVTKCNVINLLVEALQYAPVDYLIEELKHWYELPATLNPKDKTGFKRDLAVIAARNQRWLNDAIQLKNRIDQQQPAQQDNTQITRTWFDEQLVALSRFNKYHINKNETTVSEFVIMVKDLKAAAAALEHQFSKN
jgi:hypothetical protein